MHRAAFRHRLRIVAVAAAVLLALLLSLAAATAATAAESTPIRIGVTKTGPDNWLLDVVRHHRLDRAEDLAIEAAGWAGARAAEAALLAGAADIIVADWIWVQRRRAAGADVTFVPYSTALGVLILPATSPIKRIEDLRGKRLGIVGGPLDLNWLLFRALAGRRHNIDLAADVDRVFGAAPLLNRQIEAGEIDAVLTVWDYAARLQGAGMRRAIGIGEIIRGLGIESKLPLVGYAFRDSWAAAHRAEVDAFFRVVRRAQAILDESDAEWRRLRALTEAPDENTLVALRDAYRAGIPRRWGGAERNDARRLYQLLRGMAGGQRLLGPAKRLDSGTFWPGLSF